MRDEEYNFGERKSDGMFVVVRENLEPTAGKKCHYLLSDAKTEAERLVKKEGVSFKVYEFVERGMCSPAEVPVVWDTKEKSGVLTGDAE